MTLPIIQRFATTAERIAYTFTTQDRGFMVDDLETGQLYVVIRSGAGFTTCAPIQNEFNTIGVPLTSFREVTSGGDVSNVAGIGGVLASDTTPIYRGDAAETQEIAWAASNSDIIAAQVTMPDDVDGARDMFVDLRVVSAGTTNAATFTVETGWDGGALVSDTATGSASITAHTATATIAAADVPAAAKVLTLMLTPAAHTTDVITLYGVKIRYFRE